MIEDIQEEQSNFLDSDQKKIELAKARQKIADDFGNYTEYGKDHVIKAGVKQVEELKRQKSFKLESGDPAFQLVTLYEFSNGSLLIQGFSEAYRTLVTNMSLQLQAEYGCKTQAEKATAHLVAQNYVRTLEIQRHICYQLNRDTYSDMSTRWLAVLEKAYDRASNQYLVSLQALQAIHQPPMNVTVKTLTTNLAQQQIVHNENVTSK